MGGCRNCFRVVGLVCSAVVIALAALPPVAQAAVHASHGHQPTYYVSLGDSYSVGYQPGLGSTPGYTVYVAQHTGLTLVNFGCGGATTSSILNAVGCPDVLPHTVGVMTYPTTTQIAAADAFITAHRGHIGLITVSIGGNDVTGCATQSNPISCVGNVVKSINANVTTLARRSAQRGRPECPDHRVDLPRRDPGLLRLPEEPGPARGDHPGQGIGCRVQTPHQSRRCPRPTNRRRARWST